MTMDDRASYLQEKARQAVRWALHRGELQRQPCEVCGEEAQAHHDSYYPEKWLTVRWLCPSHHKQWHTQNEPIWPTIYEFHPSDAPLSIIPTERQTGKRGRKPKPWMRKATGTWHVMLDGKQRFL